MIINRIDKEPMIQYAYLNIFPDQFKTEKEKEDPAYVKNVIDYFANVAYAQYRKHRDTFVKNYDLLKGIIQYEDYYTQSEVKSFTETLYQDNELPSHVKHYPIINPPLNTLIGEISKRPDNVRIRAFDDDSKSEEMEFRSTLVQQLIMQEARESIMREVAMQGQQQPSDEDLQKLTFEKAKEFMTDYTSLAERWGNHMITALKARFNTKEKSEDAFRDLLASSREFFHIFEDNSKIGFGIEVLNPKNEWHLGTPDVKYTSSASGESNTPYAAGTVHVMEISEIIEKCQWLTKDEIDHLRTSHQDYGLVNIRESNLYTNETGIESIKYDTYNRLVLQERMMVEAELKENKDELRDWLGLTSNTASFGYKYTVVRAYWNSKRMVGRVTYLDEQGNEQTALVDENYKESPNQVGQVEWGWVNQWYMGMKVGPDIYHIEPFQLLDYCPIIGVVHEIKNTTSKSLVDMMKPYQMIFNLVMNQLWERLEKDWGMVYKMQLRRVPTPKDGDGQDAIEQFEEEARTRGIIFEDDSPENLKVPISNQQVSAPIDLSRHNEIQARYNLAVQLQEMCWALVGVNKERLGGVAATQTATGTNTALTQSFAQTEPLFVAHEYVLMQLYQAMLDAAQHVESKKPVSALSYITAEGESAFIQVTPEDIKLRDLWVIPTNRQEDQDLFREIRALSQPAMQNGASFYDIINLYSTNSIRQMRAVFKDLKDKQDEMAQQQQQLQQQELQQKQQAVQMEIEAEDRNKELDRIQESKEKELDRESKERIAVISTFAKQDPNTADANNDNIPDIYEIANLSANLSEVGKKHDVELQKLETERQKILSDSKLKNKELDLKNKELDISKANQANDLRIAKINASKRPKPTPKKKGGK